MEEKLQRVTLWLKKIYGDQPIPQYEMNARTVDTLYELAECIEARGRDVSLLIEGMKQRATQYEEGANYLEDLLTESLGLSLCSLSKEGIGYFNVLVNSAITLETKDTSLASLFCAISGMSLELFATETKNTAMERELTNMKMKLAAALMLEKQLEEDIKKAEARLEIRKAKADGRLQNLKFLKDKSDDLKIRIGTTEAQLVATRLDRSLTHESLVSLSEKLAGLQEEIVPLKKELDTYLDLTPNLSLAQVKIEEVKRQLDVLEAQFSKEIDMLTLEMSEPRKLIHLKWPA